MDGHMLPAANEAYDQNKFDEAISLYRQLFLEREPSEEELSQYDTSVKYADLLFLKMLRDLYPTSVQVRLAEANSCQKLGNFERAISIYTEVLEDQDLDQKLRCRVTLLRFMANSITRLRRDDLFVEDLFYLWHLEKEQKRHVQIRKILAYQIAMKLELSAGVSLVEKLLANEELPNELKALLEIKQQEIEYLKNLKR